MAWLVLWPSEIHALQLPILEPDGSLFLLFGMHMFYFLAHFVFALFLSELVILVGFIQFPHQTIDGFKKFYCWPFKLTCVKT